MWVWNNLRIYFLKKKMLELKARVLLLVSKSLPLKHSLTPRERQNQQITSK